MKMRFDRFMKDLQEFYSFLLRGESSGSLLNIAARYR